MNNITVILIILIKIQVNVPADRREEKKEVSLSLAGLRFSSGLETYI